MFSKIFIARPKLAIVVSVVLVFSGLLSLTKLPVAEYPEIAPPSISVHCTYAGAGCEVVRDTVAVPLEAQFNSLEDLLYFSSSCDNSGGYSCTITFKPGINSDIAMVNVQNSIKRAEALLPSEVNDTGISVRKRSGDMLAMFVFMTDGTEMSTSELSNYVSTYILDTITRIEGVAELEVWGGQSYSMRIWLDPLRMAGLGISVDDIAAAVRSQNLQAASGNIGSQHSNDYLEYKLNVLGRLTTPEQFGDIVVRSDGEGNILRLKDVATVELGAKDYKDRAIFNGKPSVSVVVYRSDDANALATVNRVKDKLDEISKGFKKGVTYVCGFDPTEFIRISLHEIAQTLIIALLLVIAITYLFMQDWRATLVPALAIPVALMGTFPFMVMMGLNINVLTMFGLILVIGSLVDDAIVVVENTQSIMAREGLDSKAAAIKSMEQITGAIIATTMVTVACYVPLAFYGGMVGAIYYQFSATMCISLCLSTFIAMTLSPAICSLIMRKPAEHPNKIFAPFNFLVDSGKSVYLLAVKFLVRRGILTLLILAGILVGIKLVSGRVYESFLPTEDKGAIMVNVELAPGATLSRTNAAMDVLLERFNEIAGIRSTILISGFSMLGGAGENCALAILDLERWDKRTTKELQLENLKNYVQAYVSDIPELKIFCFTPPPIMGLGMSGDLSLQFCSDTGVTAQELAANVNEFCGKINQLPEALYAMSTFTANDTQLFLDIDRQKAETLGVQTKSIFSTLQSQLASYYINDFNMKGESYYVKMQSTKENRSDIDDIRNIMVPNVHGESVPLSSIADLQFIAAPRRLQRYNKMDAAQVRIQAIPGVSSGRLLNLVEKIELPQGYHIEWTDMSLQEKQNQGKLLKLMLLAVIFAYLFLVGQYESWTIPVPVMLTVSTAAFGGMLGLFVCGMSLSIYAQLGMVMLIGLTAKNAILMVEFSKQERESGLDVYTAAVNGASLRFRAVMMTAWSFLFGVFPLVVASGPGAASRQDIGITTFSGMLVATLFGIIMTPALYAVFQRMRETVKGLWTKK